MRLVGSGPHAVPTRSLRREQVRGPRACSRSLASFPRPGLTEGGTFLRKQQRLVFEL